MIGNLRLISGLILFLFVLGHFSNHALGIISLRAMNDGLAYTVEPWRTLPGTIILAGALTIHVLLAIWSLFRRKSFRVNRWEAAQVILGFLIPIVLAAHVLSTRGAHEAFGLEEGYAYQLHSQWVAFPFRGFLIALAMTVVWTHACIGWHYWLRLKPWYERWRLFFFSAALIVPLLALTGYISAGFRVLRLSNNEKWVEGLTRHFRISTEELQSFLSDNETAIQLGVAAVILSALAFHITRTLINTRPGSEKLQYRSIDFGIQKQVSLRSGMTLLDQIRDAGIPHASVCGGRGRCSTCRVRVEKGRDVLPKPEPQEAKVLQRISAPENVRLACQIVPQKGLEVTALLSSDATAKHGFARHRGHDGDEQNVAILFADIRAFTKFSESKLPYDVAFILNRYFAAMGQAVEEAGGHLDKFIGDGVMAIFGIDKPIETGCREAVQAAVTMAQKLEKLNESLASDLEDPLKIGIGIHSGTAIIGSMGYNQAVSLTAIGDVVNTSSRLEGLTKELGTQLVISERTARDSGLDFSSFEKREVPIRGRVELLSVYAVESALKIKADNQ